MQHCLDMFYMLTLVSRVDEDVVQIYDADCIEKVSKGLVYVALERCGSVG
jgi:hypothetical protein